MKIWTDCYNDGWKGIIVDEAMSHPAKFARGLITRIIKHALDNGYIQPGGVVVDPFGGQAGGALPAMQAGFNWVGVELEPKFVDLGNQNIALWNQRYAAHFPKWGSAVLLQGDSRRLAEVIGAAGIVVSSPPYAEQKVETGKVDETKWSNGLKRPIGASQKNSDGYGSAPGQLGAMPPGPPPTLISSPPFAGNTGGRGEASRNGIDAALFDRHSGGMKKGTGSDPANLDHLPMGKPMVVSSPPYADGCTHTGGNDKNPEYIQGGKRGAYGVAVVGSPPFSDSVGSDDPQKRGGLYRDPKRSSDVSLTGSYGESEGQLGAMVVGEHSFAITLASKSNCGIISPKENELCQDVKIAESKSPEEADGVDNASKSTLANLLKDEKSQTDSVTNSQMQSLINQCLTIGGSSILIGVEEMTAGAGTLGENNAARPLSETDINAQDVVQSSDYKSTTKKTKIKLGESGITNLTTSKPSVLPAISNTTDQNGTTQYALTAENEPEQRPLSNIVLPNAKENLAGGHRKGLTENSTKPINALSAEKNLSGNLGDINTAPQSVQAQPEQQKNGKESEEPDTFWNSAKTILDQCALILPIGAYAIWVLKAYVKNGAIVDFPGQWQALCEACGFETVEVIHASLVKRNGSQQTIDGDTVNKDIARKSFFRRLHERKRPDLAIDYETVLITRKR